MFPLSALSSFILTASPSIDQMTIEEKVGQTLMVHFNGEEVNADATTLVQEIHVGGIQYYNWANGLTSPRQVQALSNDLQKLAASCSTHIPLFIAVDQEGGVVNRLSEGFTVFPGNLALGIADNMELAELAALATSKELKAVGVNFNLAPVVDIASRKESYIGVRASADTAEAVVKVAKAQLKGFKAGECITSLKHFPGHGDVVTDSHEELPILKKSLKNLMECELVPYMSLEHIDTIMTAHILVPALDKTWCATLSSKILDDLLRKQLKFDGVVISDSLVMEGLLRQCPSIEQAAISAFNAGCDIIMLGGKQLLDTGKKKLELNASDVKKVADAMVQAVKAKIISKEKLDASVKRILALKKLYKLDEKKPLGEAAILAGVATKDNHELAEKIAGLALKICYQQNQPISLRDKSIAIIAPSIIENALLKTAIHKVGKSQTHLFMATVSPSEEERKRALTIVQEADVALVFSYNAWKTPSQLSMIQELTKHGKLIVLVALRDPQDATLVETVALTMTTCSPSPSSINVVVEEVLKFN